MASPNDGAWRSHPLMRFAEVKRWMRARELRSTYRLGCLQALQRYVDFRKMTPSQLILESITSRGELDPELRLKPKDMLNKWKEDIGNAFGSVNAVRRVLPFFEENAATIEMLVQNPKTPARETRTRATQELSRRFLDAAPEPEYKWGIICEAETGMRPNSLVNLEWGRITEISDPFDGLQIQLPGRITKTGQPYWAFTFEDAQDILNEWKDQQDETRGRVVNYSAQTFEHYIDNLAHRLGVNPASGLRPFTCGRWRSWVQDALEGAGVPQNRVSLLMGAQPKGRDAHYANPPPEVLAEECLKAEKQLRIL